LPAGAFILIAALRGPLRVRALGGAVARAAVAAQVDQALDGHLHLAAQVALDREARHAIADALHLGVGEVLDLARPHDPGGLADRQRARAADAIDRGQRDAGVLVVGDVDACDSRHVRCPGLLGGKL